jgi:RES domain-containing protein
VSQAFGDAWFDSRRSPVLRVPSVVTRGPEFNLVLNTLHPQFKYIHADDPVPVVWDKRLAAKRAKRRNETAK